MKMMAQFIGRTFELKELRALWNKQSASLVVIKGRRRIGKSRLVEEFAKGETFYVNGVTDDVIEAQYFSQIIDFSSLLTG
jgi:AAA+ ATPase superfamily predicted ATPase